MATENPVIESSSDDESDEDQMPSVEEISKSGGRKPRTIAAEANYYKKWTDFLVSRGQVKILLRFFINF